MRIKTIACISLIITLFLHTGLYGIIVMNSIPPNQSSDTGTDGVKCADNSELGGYYLLKGASEIDKFLAKYEIYGYIEQDNVQIAISDFEYSLFFFQLALDEFDRSGLTTEQVKALRDFDYNTLGELPSLQKDKVVYHLKNADVKGIHIENIANMRMVATTLQSLIKNPTEKAVARDLFQKKLSALSFANTATMIWEEIFEN